MLVKGNHLYVSLKRYTYKGDRMFINIVILAPYIYTHVEIIPKRKSDFAKKTNSTDNVWHRKKAYITCVREMIGKQGLP